MPTPAAIQPPPLEQQSCLPIMTLQGTTSAAVSDVSFVYSPLASSPHATNKGHGVNFLVTVDRVGGIRLWNLSLRRIVAEYSYPALLTAFADKNAEDETTSLSSREALQRKLRNDRMCGLLAVHDLTSLLVSPDEVDHALEGVSALPSHPVAVLVQGRNQLAALVMLHRREVMLGGGTGSLPEAMDATVEAVVDVPQFGFCRVSILPTIHVRGRETCTMDVLVAVPGESTTSSSSGGAFAVIHRLCRASAPCDSGIGRSSSVSCSVYSSRCVLVHKSVRCGQLMSISFALYGGGTRLVSVVATESGHAIIGVHAVVVGEVADGMTAVQQLQTTSFFVLRCCAETLMHARLTSERDEKRWTLVCVSAEGHVQSYQCEGILTDEQQTEGKNRHGDQEAVAVPHWPLVWEHTVVKGIGTLETAVLPSSAAAEGSGGSPNTLVLTGGWDGTVALLDSETGAVVTALHFHKASVSGVALARMSSQGPLLCPGFAKATRMSRLGGNRSKQQGNSSAHPLVFVSTAEDGTIAVWRLNI